MLSVYIMHGGCVYFIMCTIISPSLPPSLPYIYKPFFEFHTWYTIEGRMGVQCVRNLPKCSTNTLYNSTKRVKVSVKINISYFG